MNIFKFSFKAYLTNIVCHYFFSTVQAKNPDKFNEGQNISDYFSGILLLNEDEYKESYKFLKKLDGLEKVIIEIILQNIFFH